MRTSRWILSYLLSTGAVAGCSSSNNNDAGAMDATTTVTLPDGNMVVVPTGGDGGSGTTGTCDNPIDLNARGTGSGTSLSITGDTSGATNNLHPYGGCTMMDGPESVFKYTVPASVTAVKVSTTGSGYNTVLYARESATCAQRTGMDVSDVICNDDSFDGAPNSTIYLTQLTAGQVIDLVVDGSATGADGAATSSSGAFTLTVSPVTLGSLNNPCRPESDDPDASAASRCDSPNACSTGGGAADGTPLCVPTVSNGTVCDPRGFTNTCASPSRCVTDPQPPADVMTMTYKCAAPGTAAGAPCLPSGSASRCTGSGLVCGTGEDPICVRELASGDECDLTGASSACPSGTTCSNGGVDGGTATCR